MTVCIQGWFLRSHSPLFPLGAPRQPNPSESREQVQPPTLLLKLPCKREKTFHLTFHFHPSCFLSSPAKPTSKTAQGVHAEQEAQLGKVLQLLPVTLVKEKKIPAHVCCGRSWLQAELWSCPNNPPLPDLRRTFGPSSKSPEVDFTALPFIQH